MGSMDRFHVRTMRRDELAFAIDLAAREGWNPGLHDDACFFAADPGGFLVGDLDGVPIACISVVSYAGRYGFLGLYIVHPEFRGRGYGIQIWNAGMDRLRGHNVGLDGVVAQQANYAKSGFRLAYRNVRHRVVAERRALHGSIASAAAVPFEAIAELDRKTFPEHRDAFLRCWLSSPAGAFVAQEGSRLTGYTVIRPCREGWKIGPLVAENEIIARHLFEAAALQTSPDHSIYIDVPEANPKAQSFISALRATPVFETARMYTGSDPAIELPMLFGVTTLELG
jgi:GNAT superfamily N-acetyltransferase